MKLLPSFIIATVLPAVYRRDIIRNAKSAGIDIAPENAEKEVKATAGYAAANIRPLYKSALRRLNHPKVLFNSVRPKSLSARRRFS